MREGILSRYGIDPQKKQFETILILGMGDKRQRENVARIRKRRAKT